MEVLMTEVARYDLTPGYEISRVIKGGWQLAGGHGRIEHEQALEDMHAFVQAGITTIDCADIYAGVEKLIGEFLRRYRDDLPPVQVHTKFVPDLDSLPTLKKPDVARAIDRSLRRLGTDCLDLVQFHWWDYEIPGYVEAATNLKELQEAGKIRHIGMTNFDVAHLREIVQAGVPVISNQIQYSLLDRRPERKMVAYCEQQAISLLCYGTVAGGFLSDRYLGAAEPRFPLEYGSLVKYKHIIDDFGGWGPFQQLLKTLRGIADKHQASIAMIATRAILQKDQVAAAIVGARHARHLPDKIRLFDIELDEDDLADIERVTSAAEGPGGDVYSLERTKGGKHATIMKYNLNREE
jgi:aryl-alcohol dehydrogenase-like predicted oxidoreductase